MDLTPSKFARAITDEAMQMLERESLLFAKMYPPLKRVRRKGFRAAVKRGDTVRIKDSNLRWTVVRRSNRYLWLSEYQEFTKVGTTINVRLPKRFQLSA